MFHYFYRKVFHVEVTNIFAKCVMHANTAVYTPGRLRQCRHVCCCLSSIAIFFCRLQPMRFQEMFHYRLAYFPFLASDRYTFILCYFATNGWNVETIKLFCMTSCHCFFTLISRMDAPKKFSCQVIKVNLTQFVLHPFSSHNN